MKKSIAVLTVSTVILALSCNSKPVPKSIASNANEANLQRTSNSKSVVSGIPVEELVLTSKEKKAYKRLLMRPRVIYLRDILDRHKNGKQLDSDPQFEQEINNALDGLDKKHITGKFILFSEDDNPMGGANLELMFQDNPNKVYNAWIYGKAKDALILRSFEEAPYYTQADIENIQIRYKKFLNDPEFGK
jgi:hypothetical protein